MNDIYIDSAILNAKVKYSPSLGLIIVDEKNGLNKRTTYTIDEILIVKETGYDEIPIEVHLMKKAFAGTIIKYKPSENAPENIKKEYSNQS